MSSPSRGRLFVATLLALALAAPWVGMAGEPEVDRIVAVGDIHGELDGLLSILQAAGLVDEEGSWTGGKTTLVQVGDFTDRGSQVRQVMDFLIGLEAEAAEGGGRVIVLLGNHEVMNLMGHLRDVTPEIYATFASPEEEALREAAWEQWQAHARRQAVWRGERAPELGEEARREWSQARPPGYFEYVEALGPDGEYGRWLRSLPTVIELGGTIFLHGGLSPELAAVDLDEINVAVARELREFDRIKQRLVSYGVALPYFDRNDLRASLAAVVEAFGSSPDRLGGGGRRALMGAVLRDFSGMRDWLSFRSDGPLWFRGYARWDVEEGERKIAEVLEAAGAERIVVGHTPPRPPSRIHARFGGRVFLIDTGMLEGHYPGGRPSALELADGRITAIYEDERVVLVGGRTEADQAAPAAPSRTATAEAGSERMAELPAPRPDVHPFPTEGEGPWLAPGGGLLPFETGDEVRDFLLAAEVLSVKEIGVGVTNPKKLLLERDGARSHAVFRYEHIIKERHRLADGTFHMFFKDSFLGEPAAYELARLLGLDTVPPATRRSLPDLGDGSIQLWIEDAMTEQDRRRRDIEPPDRIHFIRQLHNMNVFDNLVHNIDRNLGNILISPDWKVWYIDCTRCFARGRSLPKPERVRQIEQRFWERLQDLDWDEVRQRLRPYMTSFELRALRDRHRRLVELIEKRIDELGEGVVLFSFDEAEPRLEPLEIPEFPPATLEEMEAFPEEDPQPDPLDAGPPAALAGGRATVQATMR